MIHSIHCLDHHFCSNLRNHSRATVDGLYFTVRTKQDQHIRIEAGKVLWIGERKLPDSGNMVRFQAFYGGQTEVLEWLLLENGYNSTGNEEAIVRGAMNTLSNIYMLAYT